MNLFCHDCNNTDGFKIAKNEIEKKMSESEALIRSYLGFWNLYWRVGYLWLIYWDAPPQKHMFYVNIVNVWQIQANIRTLLISEFSNFPQPTIVQWATGGHSSNNCRSQHTNMLQVYIYELKLVVVFFLFKSNTSCFKTVNNETRTIFVTASSNSQ